eukprot:6191421-Pleurochrysis_carterae.AAC.8
MQAGATPQGVEQQPGRGPGEAGRRKGAEHAHADRARGRALPVPRAPRAHAQGAFPPTSPIHTPFCMASFCMRPFVRLALFARRSCARTRCIARLRGEPPFVVALRACVSTSPLSTYVLINVLPVAGVSPCSDRKANWRPRLVLQRVCSLKVCLLHAASNEVNDL